MNQYKFRKQLQAPTTPPDGKGVLYFDSDSVLKFKNSKGNVGIIASNKAPASANGATPAGTTSLTLVMAGLAGSITPSGSGRILLVATGMLGNSIIGDGTSIQLSHGTGTAPVNGAAVAGTQDGLLKSFVASTAAGKQGFACSAVVTGLTLQTAYWFDLAFAAITGGTATLYDVDILAIEL